MMEAKKCGSSYLIRLDRGEEILTALTEFLEKEDIRLGFFSGLGAADHVQIGIFGTAKKQYESRVFEGDYEISNLFGTVSRKDGKPYIHSHITIGSVVKNEVHAGHLNGARISATAEIALTVLEGEAGRRFDEAVGLNLLDFS